MGNQQLKIFAVISWDDMAIHTARTTRMLRRTPLDNGWKKPAVSFSVAIVNAVTWAGPEIGSKTRML